MLLGTCPGLKAGQGAAVCRLSRWPLRVLPWGVYCHVSEALHGVTLIELVTVVTSKPGYFGDFYSRNPDTKQPQRDHT